MSCLACAQTSIFATQPLPSTEISAGVCSCILNEKKIAIQLDRYTKPAFSISPTTGSTPSLKILLRGKEDILLPKTVKGISSSAVSEKGALSRMIENLTSLSMGGVMEVCKNIRFPPEIRTRVGGRGKPRVLHIGCGTMLVTKKISELLGADVFGIDFIDRSPPETPPEKYEWIDVESVPRISTPVEGASLKNIPISFPSARGIEASPGGRYPPGDAPSFFAETEVASLDVIFITDILHHILHFCALVKWCEVSLKKGGYLVIQDVDCQTWEDAYVLDAQHRCFYEIASEAENKNLDPLG